MSRSRTSIVVAVLLALYLALSLGAAWNRGVTFDETAHIAAGYNAWLRHDLRFDPANGDFVKRWASLPLLVLNPVFPGKDDARWRQAEYFTVGRDFLFRLGNDPVLILRACRAMVALLGAALGFLVFVCSRSLFGERGGLISLILFVVCPHMEAYGATVSTEIPAALALMASAWCLWVLLHRLTVATLLLSLLATSVLAISKLTVVLLVPVAAILVLLRLARGISWKTGMTDLRGRGRMAWLILVLALAHVAAAWGMIWAAYDFRYEARADPAASDETLVKPSVPSTDGRRPPGAALVFIGAHHLLPEGYFAGLSEMAVNLGLRPSFLNGTWRAGGSAAFFPYALWAKTPPFLWLILLLAVLRWRRAFWYASAPLWVLFAVYAAAALSQNVNIGHRHILPLYPLLYALAGAAALWTETSVRTGRIILGLAVAGVAVDALSVWPHSFAYFSPLVGGPSRGYQHLVDSSLDWGQDLPELAGWFEAHAQEPAYLSYFGTGDPDYYHVRAKRLEGFPDWRSLETYALEPGLYAISATMFQGLYTQPFGPWTEPDEREYQRLITALGFTRENARTSARLDAVLTAAPGDAWQSAYSRYEKLRLIRLCGWLRAAGRLPDAEVGHSILIWRLDQGALDDALWGPPAELRPTPEGVAPSQ